LRSIDCAKCGSDTWDIYKAVAQCRNCNYQRNYIRKIRHDDVITKSQNKRITQIKHFFEKRHKQKLSHFETKLQDKTGIVYISVRTCENVFTQEGGHFAIGRNGGLKVLSTYDFGCDRKRYYTNMLK